MATMRPTKTFVVEYKRNSRTAPSPHTIPVPDRAVENPRPAARKFESVSQTAASAIFRKAAEDCPSIEMPLVARRILPVIIVEHVATPDPNTVAKSSVVKSPAATIPRKVSRPKVTTINQPDISKDPGVETEKAAATVASEASTLPARKLPGRRFSRLKKVEENLPRGQRWKRRLPKFMR